MKKFLSTSSQYRVMKGKILRTAPLSPHEKLFEIALPTHRLNHDPGQFVQVSLFGAGEAPISVCTSPTQSTSFELCVRKAGKVTAALHRLEAGDEVGIRGPFGRGFPVRVLEGNDLLLIAGGLGIVPLRSLIHYIMDNRRDFGRVAILLGCKTPQDMLFGDEVEAWSTRMDVNFSCTVDRPDPDWHGHVGVITSLIPGVNLDSARTFAVIVGPPAMYSFVIKSLLDKNIPERHLIVSLERHMKCGLGRCGHCQINGLYCCRDGPVFSYDEIKNIQEAL